MGALKSAPTLVFAGVDEYREHKEALAAEVASLEAAKAAAVAAIKAERVKAQVLEQALAEARANAKWSWRRRMAKASGDRPGTA